MLLPLIDHWAVASQQQALRNAMVASTRLTQRRAEALEVERYLASLAVPRPEPMGEDRAAAQ